MSENKTDKYGHESQVPLSRVERNKELYKKLNTEDLEDYKVGSNQSVLNVKGDVIDIGSLRQMLDNKYRDTPARKSIDISLDEESPIKVEETTKEYDLGSVLSKAKEEKVINYEEERLKKIRDTQFNILNDIVVENHDEEEDSNSNAEEELMTLIKTITSKEHGNGLDPLDILSELKGSENTGILPPIEEVEAYEEMQSETASQKKLANSFYTGKLAVHDEDFDDFDELNKEINSDSILVKILLIVVFIVIIFAIVFFVDKFFALGIF